MNERVNLEVENADGAKEKEEEKEEARRWRPINAKGEWRARVVVVKVVLAAAAAATAAALLATVPPQPHRVIVTPEVQR